MAKRKHPTIYSLRQGQTIYIVVDRRFEYGVSTPKFEIVTYFLYSHNTELCPRSRIIEKMPVSHLKNILIRNQCSNNYFSTYLYYKKKYAEKYIKDNS